MESSAISSGPNPVFIFTVSKGPESGIGVQELIKTKARNSNKNLVFIELNLIKSIKKTAFLIRKAV
jgi:hypothetical protein